MEFGQILTYAPLTPFFFMLALRFFRFRERIGVGVLCYTCYSASHSPSATSCSEPQRRTGYWDRVNREWTFAIWDSHTHSFRPLWPVLQSMFLSSVVDDLSGAYASIRFSRAHALSYYPEIAARRICAPHSSRPSSRKPVCGVSQRANCSRIFSSIRCTRSRLSCSPTSRPPIR